MSYRFYPLRNVDNFGILEQPGKLKIAEFLAPGEAKKRALVKHRREELELLEKLRLEIKYASDLA